MKRWLLFSLVLTAAALASSLYVYFGLYDRLPDRLPIHWGIQGQPDDWVAKENALWALLIAPGGMAAMILLGLILPWLSPRNFDVERFRPTYEYIIAVVVALFGYIHVTLLLAYLWHDFDVSRFLVGGLFVFFAILGNVMGKVRRNFWVGVRTPWTLASETVWNRTHRVAAWLWTVGGLLGAGALLLGVPLVWCFWGLMAVALFPVVYSLVLYKRLEKQGKLTESGERS
jgi:immunity protein, SdpI family